MTQLCSGRITTDFHARERDPGNDPQPFQRIINLNINNLFTCGSGQRGLGLEKENRLLTG